MMPTKGEGEERGTPKRLSPTPSLQNLQLSEFGSIQSDSNSFRNMLNGNKDLNGGLKERSSSRDMAGFPRRERTDSTESMPRSSSREAVHQASTDRGRRRSPLSLSGSAGLREGGYDSSEMGTPENPSTFELFGDHVIASGKYSLPWRLLQNEFY